MESIRKWFYKPKKDDSSLLAQFFYADEDLNMVTAELDSFDGRKDPQRCTSLVSHLRQCQDKVLTIFGQIMNELIPNERAPRDFRAKFPEEVIQENLAGQLWFGAECLASGSSIMNLESVSIAMRPLAKAVIKALENVRVLLRDQCFRASSTMQQNPQFSDNLLEALKIFDRLFAEFELRYVSAMVPVKTTREYFLQQMVVVLFSETLQRALRLGLLSQELVDDYDPALMFTIPRLAIVSGLLIYPHGPICLDRTPAEDYMSEMFRPFRALLLKIRKILRSLTKKELMTLERMLCSCEEPAIEWNCMDGEKEVDGDTTNDNSKEENADSTLSIPQDSVNGNEEAAPCANQEEENKNGSEEETWSHRHQEWETDDDNDSDEWDVSQPLGFLIQNRVSQTSHGSNVSKGPVIEAHSLPDVDHSISMNIVTEALSSLLPISPDSFYDDSTQTAVPTTSSASLEPPLEPKEPLETKWEEETRPEEKAEPERKNTRPNSTPINQTSRYTAEGNNYRIRTSTRTPLQTFDRSGRRVERRKRRRVGKDRPDSSVQVSFTLQIPSQTKRLSPDSSLSSSYSSSNTSDSDALSDDSNIGDNSLTEEDIREIRAPFRSSEDLVHRLFVCIAGAADQLQSNFASDLRAILKCVFQMNATQSDIEEEPTRSASPSSSGDSSRVESAEEAQEIRRDSDPTDISPDSGSVAGETVPERPPEWVPDGMAPSCMTCKVVFTLVRRRHHCRNCGKVFCSRCSSNSVPLPRFGHLKPVRVCTKCFLYHVTPFTMNEVPVIQSEATPNQP